MIEDYIMKNIAERILSILFPVKLPVMLDSQPDGFIPSAILIRIVNNKEDFIRTTECSY